MKIAVEGCCHGELDAIYSRIASLEKQNNYKVSLLLICGDFQAIRNERDLQCMAVPDKYRKLGEFWKYYTGQKKAPVLTIVIGGNHEASNYFWELYHGGWVAPNIYFLGHAGCVQVNGIRIAGASGIWKRHDFHQGHNERLPYSSGAMRSLYHVREYNIRRLSLLSSPSIFLSHDWPQSIVHYGDLPGLLRRKPFFRNDIDKGELGSPPMMELMRTLKPRWWFSAHLHVKFEATVVHEGHEQVEKVEKVEVKAENPDEIVIEDIEDGDDEAVGEKKEPEGKVEDSDIPLAMNPDEITLDDEEIEVEAPPPPPKPVKRRETKFLALDKCLPKRQFLEIVDVPEPPGRIPPPGASKDATVLSFDPEWLAITRAFNPYMSTISPQASYPDEATAREAVQMNLEWVQKNVIEDRGITQVEDCQLFCETAPPPGKPEAQGRSQPPYYPNPQTALFCSMLEIENKVDVGK